MSKQTVYRAVDFAITEGQLEAFEGIAQTMVAGTQKEPGALAYELYFSADRKKCRFVETYADANAVLAHCNGPVVQELVAHGGRRDGPVGRRAVGEEDQNRPGDQC